MKVSLILLTFLVSFNLFACFEMKELVLKDHQLIEGFTVNHRVTFFSEKKKRLKALTLKSVISKKDKAIRSEVFYFKNAELRLNADKVSRDNNIFDLTFLDNKLEKKIRIVVDYSISQMKQKTRGRCAGELRISKF
jgi:hypothetical protein